MQPYKIGPDYIDGAFYRRFAGRPAYNVDLWLDGEEGVRRHVAATAGDANVLLFEGMMGLFDGDDEGATSTARVASLLEATVLVVLDCWRASQTAAAVALGLREFDARVKFGGVMLNRVAGPSHERAVRAACASVGLNVLAAIPYEPSLESHERLLGLDPDAVERRGAGVEGLAQRLYREPGLQMLFADARAASEDLGASVDPSDRRPVLAKAPRIAYACDEAFSFTYQETLDALLTAGAQPVPFSPLEDSALPPDSAGLWLGGGYPELHAARLEANPLLRAAIRDAVARGLPTYAECGGLMFLAERLTTAQGEYEMCGAIRGGTTIAEPRLHIGYRRATVNANTPLDSQGAEVRGYEYHYATSELAEGPAAYSYDGRSDGVARASLVAAFLHRHFLPGDGSLSRFVARCSKVCAFGLAAIGLVGGLVATPAQASAKPRIVSLVPSLTEDLFAIGAGPQVVGVSQYSDVPKAAARLPVIASAGSIASERILRLHPDVVVGIPAQAQLVADLRRAGLRLVLLRDDDFEDIFRDLEALGKISGHENNASALARRLRARTAALLTTVPPGEPPRCLVVLDVAPIFTVGDRSFIASLIRLAGGRNAAGDLGTAYARYSAEALLALQPDVIITDPSTHMSLVLDRPPWRDLNAVRTGRVYVLEDPGILERPGPRYNDGLAWLISKLRPHAR